MLFPQSPCHGPYLTCAVPLKKRCLPPFFCFARLLRDACQDAQLPWLLLPSEVLRRQRRLHSQAEWLYLRAKGVSQRWNSLCGKPGATGDQLNILRTVPTGMFLSFGRRIRVRFKQVTSPSVFFAQQQWTSILGVSLAFSLLVSLLTKRHHKQTGG